MRTHIMVLISVLAALLLAGPAGVAAQEESTWQPAPLATLDPTPWRTDSGIWAAATPDEEPVFLEIRATRDTFVASNYPFDNRSFEREPTLWFGTDTTLGHLRTLLRWDLPRIPGAQYVAAAVYLPVAGGNANLPMAASAYRVISSWPWDSVHWFNQPPTAAEPLARFTVGAEPGWLWFDVSALVAEWWQNAYSNHGIQLRGPETTVNVAKGMFSREAGDDAPVPTLVIAYMPDRTPPTCTLRPLPPVSPGPIQIGGRCIDMKSGINTVELEVRQPGQTWQPVPMFAWWHQHRAADDFPFDEAQGGRTYEFRLRATDWAGNTSAWTPDGAVITTVESTPPEIIVTQAVSWLRTDLNSPWVDYPDYDARDPGPISSGIGEVQLAYVDEANQVWQRVYAWSEMRLQVNHRYSLYARAIDRARNVGAWTKLSTVTGYYRRASGALTDATGAPLAGFPLQLTPPGLNQVITDAEGRFEAYLASANAHILSSAFPGYELDGDDYLAVSDKDVRNLAVKARHELNIITNGRFTQPLAGAWQTEGAPVLTQPREIGNNNPALRMGAAPEQSLFNQQQDVQVALAAAPDGSLHLSWTEPPATYNAPGTLLYTWRPAGEMAWQPIERLGVVAVGPFSAMKLAADAHGDLHLIYAVEGDWVYRSRQSGGNWSEPEIIPLRRARFMSLATDPSGDIHLLMASDAQDWADALYYLTRNKISGWRDPVRLPRYADRVIRIEDTSLLVTSDRKRYVAYRELGGYREIGYTESSDGQNWSSPVAFPDADGQATLVQSPNGDVYLFWLRYVGESRVFYARKTAIGWDQPRQLWPKTVTSYAIAFDADGQWLVALNPFYPYRNTLLRGVNPALMTRRLTFHAGSASSIGLASSRGVTAILRRTYQPWNSSLVFSVLDLRQDSFIQPFAARQPVILPAQADTLLLDWRAAVRCLDTEICNGNLYVELADAFGEVHILGEQKASPTEEQNMAHFTADLTPWRGQPVTLTFRFDPRGDSTAWAWVDDVFLGTVPLNVGVSLARNTFPKAGQPFTFTLTVANRRPYPLNVPVELNWPADWPLNTCTASGAVSLGAARFEVPVDGMAEGSITCTVDIPPETGRIVKTISATIGQLIATQDYTPADNRVVMTVIVDGRLTWLPVIAR